MSDRIILILFLSSLLLYVILFCIVRFYLFKYFTNKKIVIDYLDFNLKSFQHTKYLYKIVFKGFDNGNFYAKRLRFLYLIKICFFIYFYYFIFFNVDLIYEVQSYFLFWTNFQILILLTLMSCVEVKYGKINLKV